MFADGKSSFVCEELEGISIFDLFRLGRPSESIAPSAPRSEVDPDLRSLLRFSFEGWPFEDVRLGIRRRDEPLEFLRWVVCSVGEVGD